LRCIAWTCTKAENQQPPKQPLSHCPRTARDSVNHRQPMLRGQVAVPGPLVYCEARYGDQLPGDLITGLTANDPTWVAANSAMEESDRHRRPIARSSSDSSDLSYGHILSQPKHLRIPIKCYSRSEVITVRFMPLILQYRAHR
jgi:hypothetical protein